ncbi:MAG: hypothetical protein ACOX60_01185 [Massiliimalia sp.]|jgi:hypothetical protein
MLFWQDDDQKPSPKKILFYCIALVVIFFLIGFIGDKMGFTNPI